MERDLSPGPRIPAATYRLQFNRQFGFSDAAAVIPYLNELGITDIYASPYLAAKRGSLHGYDIVDPRILNPEVGAEAEYDGMIGELRKFGMGHILDIVPNHLCITSRDNGWWMDLLENGMGSAFAHFFDIDWRPAKAELRNKVLLPILADQYGNVLDRRELKLVFMGGAFFIEYFEHQLPVRPRTYGQILKRGLDELGPDDAGLRELRSIIADLDRLPVCGDRRADKVEQRTRAKEEIKQRLGGLYEANPAVRVFIDGNISLFNSGKERPEGIDLLDRLLRTQVYRLSHWSVATDEINYRRFFDINDLAALRAEDPDVFEETHRLIFRLVAEGKVSGLRVDHPDGLYNPAEYLHRLQRGCFVRRRVSSGAADRPGEEDVSGSAGDTENGLSRQYHDAMVEDPLFRPFYIVGEKILTRGERIPDDWPFSGSTGYTFLNSLNGIFVDTQNERAFEEIYSRLTGKKTDFDELVREKKKLIMQVAMSSEVSALGQLLNRMSERDRHTRDFTLNSLTAALVDIISCFPVYRTYVNSFGVSDRDKRYIEAAIAGARRLNPSTSSSIFDFIGEVLLLRFPGDMADVTKHERLGFVMRFQQITAPVMAKGLEDTAFYVYNRLASLNEVGGWPDRFGTGLDAFHGQNIDRLKNWPDSLITTSTHDSKRSEDVRSRIDVLSEMPEAWREGLRRWSRLNRKWKSPIDIRTAPDRNEEYLLYQTLIGAWPFGTMDDEGRNAFVSRIKAYMLKAAREAKVNTSWVNPDSRYEAALDLFIDRITGAGSGRLFLKDFERLRRRVAACGIFNSLSQTLLKITCPGVPDFYQGTELWDFSLVDPDNRRPVDFGMRARMLEELKKKEAEIDARALAAELLSRKEDGAIKLYVIWKALRYRSSHRALFGNGEYLPLEATGDLAGNVCAFVRRLGAEQVIVAAPRFFTRLTAGPDDLPLGGNAWKDSALFPTAPEAAGRFRNIMTGEIIETSGQGALYLSEVFASFPVALLEALR